MRFHDFEDTRTAVLAPLLYIGQMSLEIHHRNSVMRIHTSEDHVSFVIDHAHTPPRGKGALLPQELWRVIWRVEPRYPHTSPCAHYEVILPSEPAGYTRLPFASTDTCRAKREQLKKFQRLLPENQSHKLAWTVSHVPYPHGGVRSFHQKSTCLYSIDFMALRGANLVT